MIFLSVLALIYRATFYWQIPVVPGEPYGLGDIIQLLLFASILLLFLLTLMTSLICLLFWPKGKQKIYWLKIAIGIFTLAVYYIVHPYVPKLL